MNKLKFALTSVVRRSGQRLSRFGGTNGFESRQKTRLAVDEFGLPLTAEKHSFFTSDLWLPRSLKREAGVVFALDENDQLIAETKHFKALVQTEEELFILNEIVVGGAYNFAHSRPVVVLDIGMNVGLAALNFAAMENVLAVIGYEPFTRTYEQAQRNFRLNSALASKITSHNCGLGSTKRRVTAEYCYEWKGMVGIHGVPEHRRQGQTISREEIVLEDVCDAVDSVVAQYPGIDIVAKIDCEGAEYELLEGLHGKNRISNITVLMMEWHNNGPSQLMQTLTSSGFSTLCLTPTSKTTGMIYSVRS